MYTFFKLFDIFFVKNFTSDEIILENKNGVIVLIFGLLFYVMYFYGLLISESVFLVDLYCAITIFSSFFTVLGLVDLLVKIRVLINREKVLMSLILFGKVLHERRLQLNDFSLDEKVEVKGEYIYSYMKLNNSQGELPELRILAYLPKNMKLMKVLDENTEDYKEMIKLTNLITKIQLSFEELKSVRSNSHSGLVY